jgi:hypothetical protein
MDSKWWMFTFGLEFKNGGLTLYCLVKVCLRFVYICCTRSKCIVSPLQIIQLCNCIHITVRCNNGNPHDYVFFISTDNPTHDLAVPSYIACQ